MVSLSGVYSAGILTHGHDVVHIRICPSLRNWLSPYHFLEFFDVFKKSESVLYVLMRKDLYVFFKHMFFSIYSEKKKQSTEQWDEFVTIVCACVFKETYI